VTIAKNNTSSGGFTVTGSTITEAGGDSYTFCVNGSSMTQRELVAGSAYGVTSMKKR
jgi:hypothetical protein